MERLEMPITVPAAGQMVSAELFGAPVANEVNRLTPLVDGRTPTPWVTCTLQNSWGHYAGQQPLSYRKVGDIVYMRGCVSGGTIGSTLTTLPAGFRPPILLAFPLVCTLAAGPGPEINIKPDGTCTISNTTNTYVHVGAIVFSITA